MDDGDETPKASVSSLEDSAPDEKTEVKRKGQSSPKQKESKKKASTKSSTKKAKAKKLSADDSDSDDNDVTSLKSLEDESTPLKNIKKVNAKNPLQTKQTIKRKKSGDKRKTLYKSVVLDTSHMADMGSFAAPFDNFAESLRHISGRRKSITKDKEEAASRVFSSKSRLKFYTEGELPAAPKPSRMKASPPLVIPSAYVPTLQREYGDKIPTLAQYEEKQRARSASKGHVGKKSTASVAKVSTSKKPKESVKSKSKNVSSKVSYKKNENDNDEDKDDEDEKSSEKSGESLAESIASMQEKHSKNIDAGKKNREFMDKKKSERK